MRILSLAFVLLSAPAFAVDADQDGFHGDVDDCDDGDPTVNPMGVEVCDGRDQDCDGLIDDGCDPDAPVPPPPQPDLDADGFFWPSDCDDADPLVFPGAEGEVCGDGRDTDCNGLDCGETTDLDGDGVPAELGDCDDADPGVFPGAPEVCADGVDQDCDGVVDEGCDNDGDGFSQAQDCDDGDSSIFPGNEEVCGDGVDQDCDGVADGGCGADTGDPGDPDPPRDTGPFDDSPPPRDAEAKPGCGRGGAAFVMLPMVPLALRRARRGR